MCFGIAGLAHADSGNGNGNSSGANSFASGRILVLPRAGLPQSELAKIVGAHGGRARKIGQSDMYIVDLPAGGEANAVAQLSRHPHIKMAELDRRVAGALTPNDPYFGSEWHLTKIGAPTAWNTTQGAGITVAILDTGVDGTHPDLAAQMVPGYNFYDNNTNTADVNGHGTAVAGAAAASSNNGIGVSSVAGQAKIHAGSHCRCKCLCLLQHDRTGRDVGRRPWRQGCQYQFFRRGRQQRNPKRGAIHEGQGWCLVVVAAGNNGINENITPTTTMIPVSANADNNDVIASWSSFGSFVALSAPGTAIWTTAKGGLYQGWQGTSLASPITAGVAALTMAANPALSNLQVEKTFCIRPRWTLAQRAGIFYYGYGRVPMPPARYKLPVNAAPLVDTTPPTASTISAPLANSTVSGLVTIDAVSAADNVGVARVELHVNGNTVAVDSAAPYAFSWDSTGVANGMVNLEAVAYDAAGNMGASTQVAGQYVSNTKVIVPG